MKNAALDIENLTIAFDTRTTLEDFSLTVDQGETVTLAGDSGSGKTTILKCLLGFHTPSAGTIRINGQALSPRTVWALRTRIAYGPQEPDPGHGTVQDFLDQPYSFRANRRLEKDRRRLLELLERLFLHEGILDKEIPQLSGGEKQRVALISALLLNRPILLLDEATSALDDDAKSAVYGLLRDRKTMTILAAAHDSGWSGFAARTVRLPSRGGAAR